MKYQAKNFIKAVLLGALLVMPFTAAKAVVLDTWNDVDLNATDDSVLVNTGVLITNIGGDTILRSWFSMQWDAGSADNDLSALGLDTVYYNSDVYVAEVWEGSIGGTNVTSDWGLNYGGVTAGGGFGDFLSMKNLDGGTTAGISSPLFFVLDSVADLTTANSQGATFAAHVRYENDCSGWVSNGTTDNRDSGSCGTTTVPEPGSLALLGMGLLGLGLVRRRKM